MIPFLGCFGPEDGQASQITFFCNSGLSIMFRTSFLPLLPPVCSLYYPHKGQDFSSRSHSTLPWHWPYERFPVN